MTPRYRDGMDIVRLSAEPARRAAPVPERAPAPRNGGSHARWVLPVAVLFMFIAAMVAYDFWSGGPFNKKPAARFEVDVRVAFVGGALVFNGSGSGDPDGQLRSYVWDFGDGINPQTKEPRMTHSYLRAGEFNASLTVIDDRGASSDPVHTTVLIVPLPSVSAQDALTGEGINFSVDIGALGNAPAAFAWSFSDGTPPAPGPAVSHRFLDEGTYDITLEVTYMSSSARGFLRVLVLNRPPSPSINSGGVNLCFTNTWITFDATASRDPDGAVTGWAWDFGDGTTDNVSGPIARHLYSRSGLFTVELNVTDDDGACAAASVDIVVAKDLVVTGFNATLYKNGDGLTLANVTVLFSNSGDAKAAGTVCVNVTSYKAGAQPPAKHGGGDVHTGRYEAPIYSQTQELSISIAGVSTDGDRPEQTWYWVELAYSGAVIDSGWYQK